MGIFTYMNKYKKRNFFESSLEKQFYLDRCGILTNFDYYAKLLSAQDPFSMIRCNIIIRSLSNKATIESAYFKFMADAKKESKTPSGEETNSFMEEVLKELPYYEIGEEKIYVPIFSRSINRIYSKDWEKLSKNPYASLIRNPDALIMDAFDYYGADLFGSYFTKLILIKRNETVSAYFDYDSMSLYFVSAHGRLEAALPLFDKYMDHITRTHMIERVTPVVNAYFAFNKEDMKKALLENKLISSRLLSKINAEENKRNQKINSISARI